MMPAVQVVRGRQLAELPAREFEALLAAHQSLTVDVGTGDGRFAYGLARRHPDRLVVGLDTARDRMREISWRAQRKPSRGGLANLLLVWASVEQPPPELRGRADEVHVVLPWGRLLAGLVLASPAVLDGIRGLASPGATIHLVLGADVWSDPVPMEVRDLPEVTVAYAHRVLEPAYRDRGLCLIEARQLGPEEIAELRSSWARRLAGGRPQPRFVSLRVLACG
jgi:16S rRNA (adenine(1408)-N(1))-methyltransferase